jgi:hypothetical protein
MGGGADIGLSGELTDLLHAALPAGEMRAEGVAQHVRRTAVVA